MWKNNKIEVLGGLRLMLKLLNLYNKNGVYVKYNKTGDSTKIPNFFVFCLISLPTITFASLLIWFVIDEKFNLKTISTTLACSIAFIQMTISYISLAVKADLIVSTIDHLEESVKQRCEKSPKAREIYENCEQKLNFLIKCLQRYSMFIIASLFLPFVFTPICYWIFGFPAPDHWYPIVPIKQFVDSKTILGYFLSLSHIFVVDILYLYLLIVTMGLFISLSIYVGTFCVDFEAIVSEMNDETSSYNKNGSKSGEHTINSISKLTEVTLRHNDMFKHLLMKNIRDLMSVIIFNVLLSCVLFFVLILLALDRFSTTDLNLLINMNCLVAYLVICYVNCHFSESITTKSFEIGDIIYNNLLWYEMSIKERKVVTLIIQQSQKEFRLTGLGLVDCSLARFLAILKTSQSYFLIFRKL